MKDLSGKCVVITGASSGIGAELARQCAARGMLLVLAARRLDLLELVAAECRQITRSAAVQNCVLVQTCDVTDAGQLMALLDAAYSRFGRIDVWVNNAGRGLRQRLLDLTREQMQEQYALNCLSSLSAYQCVLPRWLEELPMQPGAVRHLIDVCSLGGKSGYAYNGAYSAAKHGLSAIGDTLRQELMLEGVLYRPGRGGIIVTTVYPGPTVSEFGLASPDLTEGEALTQVLRARQQSGYFSRKVSATQATSLVASAMVTAMLRPVWTLYPHHWANLAVLLNNLAPGLTLSLIARTRRK